MRAALCSDIHLGYRAYSATDEGRNTRECDVERAWWRVVDNITAADPDLVLIGGDVVHHPRVGVHAIKAWRDGIRRIVEESRAEVIAIPGNHDVGRTSESRTPLCIPDDLPRFQLVEEPRRVQLTIERTGERVAIACLPFQALASEKSYRLVPDEAADVNCLLIHAPLAGEGLPRFYAGETSIDVARVAESFDVLAAGDWHDFTRLHPERLACYPGAVERTSSNVWKEWASEKGVVVVDTATGALEFVPHETRPVLDFRLLDFDLDPLQPTAEDVNGCLATLAEDREAGVDGAIVRLRVDDLPRDERELIAWDVVRELKHRALHFQLDLRWAERDVATMSHSRGGGHRFPELVREFFAGEPEDVRACAFSYLDVQAEAQEPVEEPAEAVLA